MYMRCEWRRSLDRLGCRALPQRLKVNALEGLTRQIQTAVRFQRDRIQPPRIKWAPYTFALRHTDAFAVAIRFILGQFPEVRPERLLKLTHARIHAAINVWRLSRLINRKRFGRGLMISINAG